MSEIVNADRQHWRVRLAPLPKVVGALTFAGGVIPAAIVTGNWAEHAEGITQALAVMAFIPSVLATIGVLCGLLMYIAYAVDYGAKGLFGLGEWWREEQDRAVLARSMHITHRRILRGDDRSRYSVRVSAHPDGIRVDAILHQPKRYLRHVRTWEHRVFEGRTFDPERIQEAQEYRQELVARGERSLHTQQERLRLEHEQEQMTLETMTVEEAEFADRAKEINSAVRILNS